MLFMNIKDLKPKQQSQYLQINVLNSFKHFHTLKQMVGAV